MNNDYCVAYHWWNDNPAITPLNDLANPVLLSAASVRKHNRDIPIYIIDASNCTRSSSDWGMLATRLRVNVIKRDSYLKHAQPLLANDMYDIRLLSRVWDVQLGVKDTPEGNVIFLDSDIFCLNPIFPLNSVKSLLIENFYSNDNNGVWIYNKYSRACDDVFDYWKASICRSMLDTEFKNYIHRQNPTYGTNRLQDEIIYRTICRRYPGEMRPTHHTENYLFHWLSIDPPKVTQSIKFLHCLGFLTTANRAKLFRAFKELWPVAEEFIEEHDRIRMFGAKTEKDLDLISVSDLYLNKAGYNKIKMELDFTEFHKAAWEAYLNHMGYYENYSVPLL